MEDQRTKEQVKDHSAENAEKRKTDSVPTIGNRTSRDELRRSASADRPAGARASETGKPEGRRKAERRIPVTSGRQDTGSAVGADERQFSEGESTLTVPSGIQAKKPVTGETRGRIIRRIRMADGRIVEQILSADAAETPGKTAASSTEPGQPVKKTASGVPKGRIIRRIRTADGRIVEQVLPMDSAENPDKTTGQPTEKPMSEVPKGRVIRRIRMADGRIVEQVLPADAAEIPDQMIHRTAATDLPEETLTSDNRQNRSVRKSVTPGQQEERSNAGAMHQRPEAEGSTTATKSGQPTEKPASEASKARIIRKVRMADGRIVEQVLPMDATDNPDKMTGQPTEKPVSEVPQGKIIRRIRTADGRIVEQVVPAQTVKRSAPNRVQNAEVDPVRGIAATRAAVQHVPESDTEGRNRAGRKPATSERSAAAVQAARPKPLDRRRNPEGAEAVMSSSATADPKSDQNPEKNRKRKKLLKVLLFLLIILILLGLFVHSRVSHLGDPYDSGNTEKVSVDIPEGSTTSTIAETLQMRGLIGSEMSFKLLTRMEGRDGDFKAGTYMLSPSMSMDEIMDELEKGYNTADTVRFTVPEGSTLKDIAEIVAKTKACTEEEFLEEAAEGDFEDYKFLADVPDGDNKLEGFLYPDTYDIYTNEKPHDIICRMLDQFESIINKVESKSTPTGQAKKYSLYERVIIASMIESECRVDDERAKIASVIYNRLDDGMKLQIDATVQYALGEHTSRVTYSDLEIDSPYNTYKVTGLPAGPICSPAQASLKAANQPEETDYMYYVLKSASSVNHNFAVTGSEFEQYRKAYLSTMK